VEKILDENEIEDADVESSLETLAKEYNKQDGIAYSSTPLIVTNFNTKMPPWRCRKTC